MAKPVKRKKISFISSSVVSLLIASFVTYIGLVIYISIQNKIFVSKILWEFSSNYQFFNDMVYRNKLIVGIVFIVIFVVIISLLRFEKYNGYTDEREHGVHGDSRFYSPDEMRLNKFAAPVKVSKFSEKDPFVALGMTEGIICGVDEDGKAVLTIPNDTKLDNRNVLVVGSSGSSKGQSFIIPNIINQKTSSIIVTDPKGELYHLTHEIKKDQGYKVLQVDFMNLVGNAFNPLDYIEDDLEAKNLAYTIARNSSKDDKEDHWFVKAADLLTGIIIYVKDVYPNPSMPIEVKQVFSNIAEDENYLPNLVAELGENHAAYLYLKEASVATGNERSGILSTFTKQTGIFNSKKVKDLTTHSDFHFSELQKQPTIIYVKVPIKNNPVAPLTATFFDLLISYLYKYGDRNHSRLDIPTILLLDEFANIGKLNGYDEILQTCRGYLLSLITVVQDFAQLQAKYGKDLYRTIINGHATKIFLKTNDVETAKYFETLAGATTVKFNTKSKSGGGGLAYILDLEKGHTGGVSRSEHYQKKNLLDHQDLMKMENENMYAFIDGKPVSLNKAFQHRIFRGLLTEEQKQLNGVSKFVYVYPKHRDKYVKLYKLQPFSETNSNPIEKTEIIQSVSEPQIVVDNEQQAIEFVQSEAVAITNDEKPVKNDLFLSNLITDFIKHSGEVPTDNVKTVSIEDEPLLKPSEATGELLVENDINVHQKLEEAKIKVSEALGDGSYFAVQQIKKINEFEEGINDIEESFEAIDDLEELRKLFETETSTEFVSEHTSDELINDNLNVIDDEEIEALPM